MRLDALTIFSDILAKMMEVLWETYENHQKSEFYEKLCFVTSQMQNLWESKIKPKDEAQNASISGRPSDDKKWYLLPSVFFQTYEKPLRGDVRR